MAELPRSFALKSNHNNKCLSLINQNIGNYHGVVKFSGDDVTSSHAMFQVEKADCNVELVHIKCTANGKYLKRGGEGVRWIVADGDEPEELQSHWKCTLFEPQVIHKDNKAVIRLLHVQLGCYLTLYTAHQGTALINQILPMPTSNLVPGVTANDFDQCPYAGGKAPSSGNHMDDYTVIDLDALALPNHFVLKSDTCDKYLRYVLDEENDNHEIVRFSGKDPSRGELIFQVKKANNKDHQENHYVHIKCSFNNKYLRRMDKDQQLIVAEADQPEESTKSWGCTLFKPVRVGQASKNHNNVLCRLLHVQSGLYTRPLVDDGHKLSIGQERPDSSGVDVYTGIHSLHGH